MLSKSICCGNNLNIVVRDAVNRSAMVSRLLIISRWSTLMKILSVFIVKRHMKLRLQPKLI